MHMVISGKGEPIAAVVLYLLKYEKRGEHGQE